MNRLISTATPQFAGDAQIAVNANGGRSHADYRENLLIRKR
jgi:hypothetical protein